MSPNEWGPPTWTLLHTLAAKIKEERYPIVGQQLFQFIVQICHNLPCPDCALHARQFLARINPNALTTKTSLKNVLYVFHNAVNKRKGKPLFSVDALDAAYQSKQVIPVFNEFARNYHTKGNMRLLSESFHRAQALKQFRHWLMHNLMSFD